MSDPDQLGDSALEDLSSLSTLEELEAFEIRYLGRNGLMNDQMKKLKDATPEERKELGQKLNLVKQRIVKGIETRRRELSQKLDEETSIDITLPGRNYPKGSLHLVSYAIEEISGIFEKIGFVRVYYPEVEWEHFAFDALNMPKDHPARDDFETFFVEGPQHEKYGKTVLTPHTSNGQVREMLRLNSQPPIRMINISKTYRPNWDMTHTPMFHQFEGLCIDENINITHLKGTIDYFAKEFFGPDREIRLRPFHFQFTEPSFEIDITCDICGGTGVNDEKKCGMCKQGWLELGGSGMVHPNVLRAGGIDTEKYSGWAFGFGVERTFMMKEGVKLPDLRMMYSDDIRFLEQF